MTDLTKLTLTEALSGLEKKEFTSVELTQSYLDKMKELRRLNAFITETPEIALQMAAESDKRRAEGKAGKLEGIPMAVKDLYCTKGVLTTGASKILSNFVPPYSATTCAHLWKEGAVLLGKTNTDEFAMGSSTITSYYGVTHNPHDETRVPGGSSGGSAAAVAAHLCAAATATETGGSIRQPAAFCKTAGIKPTYGRCSRFGILAYSSSLDHPGVVARTIEDVAKVLEVMAGHDEFDSTSLNMPVPEFSKMLDKNIKGMKIGIPKEYTEMVPEIWDRALAFVKEQGAELVEISLPHTEQAASVYYITTMAEASSNLARYDGVRFGTRVDGKSLDEMYMETRMDGFGAEVRRRLILGTYFLSAKGYFDYFVPAQKMRRLIAEDFDKAFEKVDVLMAPTVPIEPFTIEEAKCGACATKINDTYSMPSALAGIPAACVPSGLQVIAPRYEEGLALKVAQVLEMCK
ncbi:MAG: Asp-tRNA(Asn)/Glu-tRNA(Gln) amidotransferase subunit GatA [Alphaproteobacteria bacterium]|nr:Asp-tRNA(Asn)/Glu-tRNA(Gln) amidotransferase subunit GatA [Alphaproteobacteria bacterium]